MKNKTVYFQGRKARWRGNKSNKLREEKTGKEV